MRVWIRHLRFLALLALTPALAACSQGAGEATNDASLDAGLVGWWRFDEGAGDVARDASGHGNSATLHGAAWAPGVSGTSLSMNGGNDGIVSIPLSASLRGLRDEITISAWAFRESLHNVALVSHGYPELFFGFHGEQFKWQLRNAWGRMAACYADRRYRAGANRWHHVAATYDGWKVRLYADGREICSKWQLGPMASPEVDWTISGYRDVHGGIVDEITGRIDEVRLYDRALEDGEISALYESRI